MLHFQLFNENQTVALSCPSICLSLLFEGDVLYSLNHTTNMNCLTICRSNEKQLKKQSTDSTDRHPGWGRGLTTAQRPPQGASSRRGCSTCWPAACLPQILPAYLLACKSEVLHKFAAHYWNPMQICCAQLESYTNLLRTTGILYRFAAHGWYRIKNCCVQLES